MRTTSAAEFAAKLTEPQRKALASLSASKFQSAHDLGVSARSLGFLVTSGLADCRWALTTSRENKGMYRITGRGCVVLGMVERQAVAS